MGILVSGTSQTWPIPNPWRGRHTGRQLGAGAAQGQEGSTVQTDALLAAICNLQPVKAKLPDTFILSVGLL